ncbi:MAG TPA: 6-hydroxymethylpterin diphosphokinase MptE-like protein [Spirochaetia bacterium]|nr:6-hydroxymethylpterin diphosphokinase MptE-like protein [Spirochaetia bacterium]
MTLGEKNREALGKRHPPVLRALREALDDVRDRAPDADGSLYIVATPCGSPTAVRDGLSVHSRRDPPREAASQVNAAFNGSETAILVFGFGLGYGVEAVRSRFPAVPILVLEPDAAMFRAALDSRDLTGVLSDERIVFLVARPPEEVSSLLASLPLAAPGFLRLRPAVQRSPSWFRAAEEVVRSWLLRRDININTLNRFGRLWVRNLIRNVGTFADAPGVARLESLFQGMPCLVLAGGPSLDDVVPHLPALSRRMLIVSVNTPVRRCHEEGVEPDYVVVVDPQYWASRFMDWSATGEDRRIIIAEPSTHPRVFRDQAAQVYLCSSLFPLGEMLETAVGTKGKLGAGGSVSTAAWDLARHLGAAPIYAAGLDLGFPGNRTHCRGVFTEDLWLAFSGRLAPQEGSAFRYLREIGPFSVTSSSGGSTPTDRRMLIYKWWFENQLLQRPGLKSFTLSPDGVAIQGMPLAHIEELLDLPDIRREIEARKEGEKSARRAEGPSRGNRKALQGLLAGLRARLDELALLAEEAVRTNDRLRAALRDGADAAGLVRELESLDARILEISERSIAGFLVQPVIHGITARGEKKASAEEVLADGAALYEGIRESASWQRDLVGRAPALLAGQDGSDSAQGSPGLADLQ